LTVTFSLTMIYVVGDEVNLSIIVFGHFCRRQEEISNEKEDIDRQRKLLGKRRPQAVDGGGTTRKRGGNNAHNGSSDGFVKPGETKEKELTWQEYYESDEIFKVRELSEEKTFK
jgi:tousled-like kinase